MNNPDSATGRSPGGQNEDMLDTVEICTGPAPTAAVVWLHGLGADGHDFEPLVPHLDWPGAPDIRYVFPHAPVRPVTINSGMTMRAWYDIVSLSTDRNQDEQGIQQSVAQAWSLVARERERGIEPGRIVVAGFSQGGAIALQLALRYPDRLAGLIALSTYLLLPDRLRDEASPANRDLPIFMAHGTADPVVPLHLGRAGADWLRNAAYPLEWHQYAMPHAVCPEEITDLAAWLKSRFS